MRRSIILDEGQRARLRDHASGSEPNESCALLFGAHRGGRAIVQDIFFTKNAEESRVSFSISNEELLRGYGEAEGRGLEVVGIFHSHPGSGAAPSPTDERFMRVNPVVWVIYSGVSEEFKAYVLESAITEVQICTGAEGDSGPGGP